MYARPRAVIARLITALPLIWFDIPGDDMSICLERWANVTGSQLIYRSSMVEGLTCKPLRGRMTREHALQLILHSDERELDFYMVNERTFTIGPGS